MYKTYFLSKASIGCNSSSNLLKSESSINEDQQDLMKLISVLVSTGINNNDDVFIREELLPAKSTGAHKPVNLEHDPKKIVGHMIRSYAASKDGKIIYDKDEDVPEDFDIVDESVIYKFNFPELSKNIKALAAENKLFVSVEAWFTAYDYLVGNKIIARNRETSKIIEPYLKANGGKGIFKNQRVGRVLRNLILGGKGIVENPANPDSIIKSVASLDNLDVSNIDEPIINNIIGNLAVANNKFGDKIMPNEIEELKVIIEAQRAEMEILKASVSKVTELDNLNKSLKTENDELKTKVNAFELDKAIKERTDIISNLGFSGQFVSDKVQKTIAMTKDEFNIYVEELKAVVNEVNSTKSNDSQGGEAGQETQVAVLDKVETNEVKKEVVENKESTTVNDVVKPDSVDINKVLDDKKVVDPVINVITDNQQEKSDVQKMGDVLQRMLKKNNPKWNNIKIGV